MNLDTNQSGEMTVEENKKPSRRRLVIYIILGVVVVCLVCSVVYIFVPRSTDDGEVPVQLPEVEPTAVQLPVETEVLPLEEPTSPPQPTAIPTAVPIVENAQAEYFFELIPQTIIMSSAMTNISELFGNYRLDDETWYDEVTSQMGVLLVTAITMEEIPVPDNCDVCKDVHDELVVISGQADEASLNWISWLEAPSEITFIDAIAVNIQEMGAVANKAAAIMESFSK